MVSRVTTALVLASVVLGVAAAPGTARDDAVFTVTAPTGTYTASTAEHAHEARIARLNALGAITRREARWLAFERLVAFVWNEGEAAERGLTLSDSVVDREFLAQKRRSFPTDRDFRRFLRATGRTVADIKRLVRHELLTDMIREQVVAPAAASVTDAVVEDYIARHGLERVPERRDIRVVMTKRRGAAVQAKHELLRGTSWKSVARRFSIDPATRHRGGRLPDVVRGTLERRLERAVFAASLRQIQGPVRTPFAFWVFRVSRIEPAHFLSHAASRQIVRQRLISQAEQAEVDRFVADFGPKWTSRTMCAPGFRASPNCANHAAAT